MKLQDAVKLTPPKILWYGPPGTWKTSSACTWGSVTEILDVDKKLAPVLSLKDQWTEERHQVEVTPCHDRDTKRPEAFEHLKVRVFQISDQCAQGAYKKKVLILDSLTTACDHAVRKIVPSNATGATARNLTLQEWGLAINEVENVLTVLKSLPICVIVLAHEMTKAVDNKTQVRILAIGDKLPNRVAVGFDEVWYSNMKVGGGTQRYATLQTVGSDIMATTRGQLPDGWDVRKGLKETLKQIGYE